MKHIPNTITLMNLLCGVMGVIFTLEGHPQTAFLLMLLAAVFDFCDGLAARMLHAYSDIGKELDSLSDLVSFGVLPSVMLYETMRLQGCGSIAAYVPLFLALMSSLRLAKFNVDDRQTSNFIGVATPTAAMICGSLAYYIAAVPDSWLASLAGSWWFLPLVAVILGLSLVSEIPMFGMKIKKGERLLDAPRIVFLILSTASAILVAVFGLNWSMIVLLVFLVYLGVNLFQWIKQKS